jgi:hypothetical protein
MELELELDELESDELELDEEDDLDDDEDELESDDLEDLEEEEDSDLDEYNYSIPESSTNTHNGYLVYCSKCQKWFKAEDENNINCNCEIK